MPFKIVRNDLTKMKTEAIVNTANEEPAVGTGCDYAVYRAAGYQELLSFRKKEIGPAKEGDVFITPGFRLPAKYIIHAVSPLYIDGRHGEEELLRACYRKSLKLAEEYGIRSIAFPLISTGGFGYPKEDGMRIAVDEIHAFLLKSDMQIYLVVFDEKATRMGQNLYPDLEAYIDRNYVHEKRREEYGDGYGRQLLAREEHDLQNAPLFSASMSGAMPSAPMPGAMSSASMSQAMPSPAWKKTDSAAEEEAAYEALEKGLAERMEHLSDTFSEYLLYLIQRKGFENSEVYRRAVVDKKVFSKIKNNPSYHPQKLTALCLCVGAQLSMDETRDLLARAGYALSPCDKTDIIFSYFIEHEIYDMIDLDIQLEEHGLPCIID